MRPLAAPWLSTQIVRDHMTLWQERMSETELAELRKLLGLR